MFNLSPRESDVATLILQGLTNKEIGAKLFIEPKSVKGHVAQIFRKTGLKHEIMGNRRILLIRLLAKSGWGASEALSPLSDSTSKHRLPVE